MLPPQVPAPLESVQHGLSSPHETDYSLHNHLDPKLFKLLCLMISAAAAGAAAAGALLLLLLLLIDD